MNKSIRSFFSLKKTIKVFVNYETREGPWGGGNQFLKALSKEFQILNAWTSTPKKATHILFNSHHDLERVREFKKKFPEKTFVHRIDGPIYLVRGNDKAVDDTIFNINNSLADLSIFQSTWSLDSTLALGYTPVSPHVIMNGADYRIFNARGRVAFSNQRKTRIISSSWSDNPRKGGSIYKWLDEHLDFSCYEYSFVGRTTETFKNIKLIPPQSSENLADLLRQHDIYITASDNDPCSNALIEALSCGLPAVYFNRGGHSEIVGAAGLSFERKEEIPELVACILADYAQFLEAISVGSIKEVSQRYLVPLALSK